MRIALASAMPVSVELKKFEKWPLQHLIGGLESQLVAKYLEDPNAHFGAYVLAQFNRSRRWVSLDGRTMLTSDEVLTILREIAAEIVEQRHDIHGLTIVKIDFSLPSV
jgi:hypothetical protein